MAKQSLDKSFDVVDLTEEDDRPRRRRKERRSRELNFETMSHFENEDGEDFGDD